MDKINILIVEDELIIAKDIEAILVKLGYRVTGTVATGEDCLEEVTKNKPDLILMDIKLKGKMDGIETSNIILEKYRIPVIYLSAHSDKTSLNRAKLTMPYGFINKPINERELFSSIETSMYRFRTDRLVKKSEAMFRSLFEQSRDAIYLRDEGGRILEVNQSMIEHFGYSREEFTGMDVRALLVDPSEFEWIIKEINEKGFIKDYETRMNKKDGSEISCLVTSIKFFDEADELSGYQVIIRDITESKRNLDKLMKTREELRFLSAHLQALREIESNNFAREIHDVLGQLLTALKIDCSWLFKKISDDDREIREKKETVLGLIDTTIDEVGRISSELRPGLLYELGLSEAAEWQAGEFIKRTGIECEVNCDIDDVVLSRDQTIVLFRIFQEALTNIIRHAGATAVEVNIVKAGDRIELTVKDNGVGISRDKIGDVRSFGLIGMRERAYSCSGEIQISGTEGGGTTIFVSIPISFKQEFIYD